MMIAAAAVVAVTQIVVQAAQGKQVQVQTLCLSQTADTVPCPALPQYWLSKKTEPGPVFTAAPFTQHGSVMTFKRLDRGAVYSITSQITIDGVPYYALAYVDGKPWRY